MNWRHPFPRAGRVACSFMRRSHCTWAVFPAALALLAAGCRSTPTGTVTSGPAQVTVTATERGDEQQARAHAHYAAGIIHDVDGEVASALDEYGQAAKLDPRDELLVLEVSRRLLENKQPEKALAIVIRATAEPGASAELFARLGLVYSQLGQVTEAIAADRTAIRKAPELLVGYQNLYLTYMRNKRPQEALGVLDEAARRVRAEPDSLIELAELYASYALQTPSQKEAVNGKALGLLKRAEARGAPTPLLQLRLADGFNLLGESERAAQLYLKVLKDPPDLPLVQERIRANLAEIYLRSSDHKRAAEQLQAILREDPGNPQVYYYLGRIALEEKQPAEAADALSKALLFKPDLESAYYYLAVAQLELNKANEARATLDKARQKFPQSFEMEFYTGLACVRQKAFREAVQHFTAAEVIAKATNPQQLTELFYFEMGAACERNGDLPLAEQYFQRCLKLAPDFAEALNYLGYMWAEHGEKLQQAREMIEKALKAEPKNAAYLDSLAWVLFKLHQPKAALPYALKAAELTEQPDATLFDHIGDIYAALAQTDKAREAWRKSLALEPNPEIEKKLQSGGTK
jgi:tetratricopeptide (TPR) repeat protein